MDFVLLPFQIAQQRTPRTPGRFSLWWALVKCQVVDFRNRATTNSDDPRTSKGQQVWQLNELEGAARQTVTAEVLRETCDEVVGWLSKEIYKAVRGALKVKYGGNGAAADAAA